MSAVYLNTEREGWFPESVHSSTVTVHLLNNYIVHLVDIVVVVVAAEDDVKRRSGVAEKVLFRWSFLIVRFWSANNLQIFSILFIIFYRIIRFISGAIFFAPKSDVIGAKMYCFCGFLPVRAGSPCSLGRPLLAGSGADTAYRSRSRGSGTRRTGSSARSLSTHGLKGIEKNI